MNRFSLLSDKFAAAALPEVCAPRNVLLDLFRRKSEKRIIYVSAPAGYGKTVSTQLWLKSSDCEFVWIGLDEYDNTLSIFYKLICTGVISLQPDNNAMADILASRTFASSPVEHTIRLLSEFAPKDKQYAIVLDDMHLVTNDEIRKSALLVQKRLPSSFIVVVLTRNEIAKEYISITGEEKCAVITASDLAFSTEEIRKYFNVLGRFITEEEAEAVYSFTTGWAIGVNAMAKSGQTELEQNNGHVLENYIKAQIWDKWDETMQTFLLKTSVLDEMTPELAEKLTGQPNSREILERLCANNMFVSKTGDECFRYHHLFLDFLRDILENQTSINISALNRTAARFFYESGKYYMAAAYYIRCGDDNGVAAAVDRINAYAEGLGVEEEFNCIKPLVDNVRGKPSSEFLSSNMFLVEMFSWYYFIDGDTRKYIYYMDILYANAPLISTKYPVLLETVNFLGALDFRVDLHVYSQILARQLEEIMEKAGENRTKPSSLTQNLPFAHRSMRDYSEFVIDTETRLTHLKSAFMPFIGKEYYVLEDCIMAGLYYEKNILEKSVEYIDSAHNKCQADFSIESKFCLQMITMAVSQAINKQDVQFKNIADMLEAENAPHLRQNLLAYETKIQLYNGDTQAAKTWLENYFVAESDHLEFYKIFQHFTTAMSFVVLKQTNKAMDYILRLKKLGTDYRRPLDIAEASVLQAVLEWALGNKKEAVNTLETALTAMQKYGFVRVFAESGAAVLPILKKLTQNLKKDRCQGSLDFHFLNEITIAAYEQSKRCKGITVNIRTEKPVKLSKQQKNIITLLSKGYKNANIVELTGLTIHTVKSHQAAAYTKLGVNNAMDAVIKAKDLGIIE